MLYEHRLVAQGLARWHKGRLIPIIGGGDGRDDLFALPPEDLSGIEDAELAALAAGLRDRIREVFDGRNDPDIVGERTQTEVLAAMRAADEAVTRIDAALAERAEADQEYEDELSQIASRAGVLSEADTGGDGGDDTDGDETPDEGDGGTDGDEGATTAAATPAATSTRMPRPLPAARRHRPQTVEQDDGSGLRVTTHAAGLGANFDALHRLDRNDLGHFLADIVRRQRVQPGQKAVLARASYSFPRERMLEDGPDSHLINSDKIRAVVAGMDNEGRAHTSIEALVASGGLCAPLPAIYDLPGVETAARPVRAALPSFQAARGGVQVGATPTMGTYEEAVGVVTQADNAAGGTSAVKNCMRIECPDFTPVTVDSIYQCIEADNLAARAYPELMARIADLVNAEQARLADSKLLTAIKAGSTNVTGGTLIAGAIFSLFGDVYRAAAGIRSRNRMTANAALQALIPAWIIDLLALDEVRQASQDNRSATRAAIETMLRQAGIVPNFYLDGPDTGTGQIFDAQAAAALEDFPPEVQWALFPAGSWLHLDSGELQLGVVRDSSLNATNDFQIFAETWENVAFTGVESLWITSELCPSGVSAGGVDTSALCGT